MESKYGVPDGQEEWVFIYRMALYEKVANEQNARYNIAPETEWADKKEQYIQDHPQEFVDGE